MRPPLVIAGLDLAAGRGTSALALLRWRDGEPLAASWRLWPAKLDAGPSIVAALREAEPGLVAIDAPLSLPAVVRWSVAGGPAPASLLATSPYSRAAERDECWRALGVRPLPVALLAGLTFRALPLAAMVHEELPRCRVIEIFPTGSLAVWLPGAPPARAKATPARREAIQALLRPWLMNLPSPSADPLPHDALDALLAALTALADARGFTQAVGDPEEGQIILPAASLARICG